MPMKYKEPRGRKGVRKGGKGSEKPRHIGIKVYERERVMLRKIFRKTKRSFAETVRRGILHEHDVLFPLTKTTPKMSTRKN